MTVEAPGSRTLGSSDLSITPVGFGAWAIGGEWQFGWGPQDDGESAAAINRALDLGVNWIDTAAVYGLGHSEEVVGKVLQGRSERPYVFTKCQRNWDTDGRVFDSLDPSNLRRECEASLRRLGLDVIDLYQIHWPRPDEEIERGLETLAGLREEGKIRHIGVCNFGMSQIERAMKIAPIVSLQPPYSAIKRGIEDEILPFCEQNGIGVIVYSPMQSGLLSGAMSKERIEELPQSDWRRANEEFQEPKLSRNLALAGMLATIGEKHGRSPGEVAIAWALRHPVVTGAIVGFRRPEQVDGLVGAGTFRLNEHEVAEIDSWVGRAA